MTTVPAHDVIQADASHDITQVDDSHAVTVVDVSHDVTVTELVLPDEGYVTSNVVDRIVTLTQAQYMAIAVPDPAILYVIIG